MKAPKTTITDERTLEQIRWLFTEKNYGCDKISIELGLGAGAVQRAIKALGLHRDRIGTPQETADEIIRLYRDEGFNLQQIVDGLHCSLTVVTSILHKAGVRTKARKPGFKEAIRCQNLTLMRHR